MHLQPSTADNQHKHKLRFATSMSSLEKKSSTPMNGCFQQTREEEEAWLYALQLANCTVLPMTIRAAIELGVFEVIVKAGPGMYLSPKDVADKLSISNPDAPLMLDRILRCLASYNVLTYRLDDETSDNVTTLYGAAPVCKYLTKNDEGVSISALALMQQDKVLTESWYHLKDAVVDGGIPFNKVYGMTVFEYLGENFRFNKLFNASLSNYSTITMKKILCSYTGFDGLNTVVDVGGGVGATLGMIITKHPSTKGINFDLPRVIADAPAIKGVEHIGGDMFESIPSGDAIFMKLILHDWNDEHCLKLLKNCWKALPEKGKVIVAEGILPIAPESSLATRVEIELDMLMLAQTGGKERTEKEFMFLANKSGFSTFKIACSLTDVFIMEFTK